jgi:hypothetical protein
VLEELWHDCRAGHAGPRGVPIRGRRARADCRGPFLTQPLVGERTAEVPLVSHGGRTMEQDDTHCYEFFGDWDPTS